MASYRMRFTLDGEIYELAVGAASSGSAIRYVQRAHPGAVEITVVG
jgi:hypothetical protein